MFQILNLKLDMFNSNMIEVDARRLHKCKEEEINDAR